MLDGIKKRGVKCNHRETTPFALPVKNPKGWQMFQIRQIQDQNGILITNDSRIIKIKETESINPHIIKIFKGHLFHNPATLNKQGEIDGPS